MVQRRWNGNGNRGKCPVPLPLLLGFVVGFACAYYYLLTGREREGTSASWSARSGTKTSLDRADVRGHRVDTTAPSANVSVSVLCLVFVGDVDSLLMQRNVWLDKCDETIYASGRRLEYLDGVQVTDTYSADPWKHLCRTLVSLRDVRHHGWMFLARDDLWLIYENLVRLVSLLNADERRRRRRRRRYHAGRYGDDGALDTDAGVLLSAGTLTALARLLGETDACDAEAPDGEGQKLDFYLRELNSTPISNMDSYGCSLFHSMNLFEAFDVNGLNKNVPKTCLSRSAISFRLDLFPNYYAMFYKYVLYQIRLVNSQDLKSTKGILPPQYSDDDIWRIEALYELNLDPSNMTQADFYHFWSKKRQIIL